MQTIAAASLFFRAPVIRMPNRGSRPSSLMQSENHRRIDPNPAVQTDFRATDFRAARERALIQAGLTASLRPSSPFSRRFGNVWN